MKLCKMRIDRYTTMIDASMWRNVSHLFIVCVDNVYSVRLIMSSTVSHVSVGVNMSCVTKGNNNEK